MGVIKGLFETWRGLLNMSQLWDILYWELDMKMTLCLMYGFK